MFSYQDIFLPRLLPTSDTFLPGPLPTSDTSLPRLLPTSDFLLPRYLPTKTFPYFRHFSTSTFPTWSFAYLRHFPTRTFSFSAFQLILADSWQLSYKAGYSDLWGPNKASMKLLRSLVTTGAHKGKKTLWWVCLVVRTGWISLYVTFLIKYVKFMHSKMGPKITPSLIFIGVVLRTPPPTMRSNRHPLPDRVNLLSR